MLHPFVESMLVSSSGSTPFLSVYPWSIRGAGNPVLPESSKLGHGFCSAPKPFCVWSRIPLSPSNSASSPPNNSSSIFARLTAVPWSPPASELLPPSSTDDNDSMKMLRSRSRLSTSSLRSLFNFSWLFAPQLSRKCRSAVSLSVRIMVGISFTGMEVLVPERRSLRTERRAWSPPESIRSWK